MVVAATSDSAKQRSLLVRLAHAVTRLRSTNVRYPKLKLYPTDRYPVCRKVLLRGSAVCDSTDYRRTCQVLMSYFRLQHTHNASMQAGSHELFKTCKSYKVEITLYHPRPLPCKSEFVISSLHSLCSWRCCAMSRMMRHILQMRSSRQQY